MLEVDAAVAVGLQLAIPVQKNEEQRRNGKRTEKNRLMSFCLFVDCGRKERVGCLIDRCWMANRRFCLL